MGFMRYSDIWFLIKGYSSTATVVKPGQPRPVAAATTITAVEIELQAAWNKKNDKALGTIQMLIEENLCHHIAKCKTALEAWTLLAIAYEKPGAVGTFVAFQNLFNTQLVDTKLLGPQLDHLHEAATQVAAAGIKVKNQLLALLMINALLKSYQALSGTILATAPNVATLKPSDVRPRIVEEESRRVANRTQIHHVSKAPFLKKKCKKCGRNNHTTEQHRDTQNNNAQAGSSTQEQQQQQGNKGKGKEKKGKGKGNVNNGTTAVAAVQSIQIVELPVSTSPSESISVSLYGVKSEMTQWLIDSGCMTHVTPYKEDFFHYHDFKTPGYAKTARKSQTIEIKGYGQVAVRHTLPIGQQCNIVLEEVLYVLQAAGRFFAPCVPVQHGHILRMDVNSQVLYEKGEKTILFIANVDWTGWSYYLPAQIINKDILKDVILMSTSTSSPDGYTLWHQRFGHASKKAITSLPGNIKGVPEKIPTPDSQVPCDGCEFSKSKHDAFAPSDSCAEHLLNLVHIDLVEYLSISINRFKYAMTTLDDHSSLGPAWYLKRKSDAFITL